MSLTLSDQDLAELTNEIMGDMRGRELRLLANFLQVKINRQLQEQQKASAPLPPVEPPKTNGHASPTNDAASATH